MNLSGVLILYLGFILRGSWVNLSFYFFGYIWKMGYGIYSLVLVKVMEFN